MVKKESFPTLPFVPRALRISIKQYAFRFSLQISTSSPIPVPFKERAVLSASRFATTNPVPETLKHPMRNFVPAFPTQKAFVLKTPSVILGPIHAFVKTATVEIH